MKLKHNEVCPIQSPHTESKCPMLAEPGTFVDFVHDELSDLLRAARGVIYGVIGGGLIWMLVSMAFVF